VKARVASAEVATEPDVVTDRVASADVPTEPEVSKDSVANTEAATEPNVADGSVANAEVATEPEVEKATVASAEAATEPEFAMGYTMTQLCDKMIDFFMHKKPKTKDWRKLLVHRDEWKKYKDSFYNRCWVRIDTEIDASFKEKLVLLSRKVKKVLKMRFSSGIYCTELNRYSELFSAQVHMIFLPKFI
jgi:hypothetical protein